jgi:hypothetical protein
MNIILNIDDFQSQSTISEWGRCDLPLHEVHLRQVNSKSRGDR